MKRSTLIQILENEDISDLKEVMEETGVDLKENVEIDDVILLLQKLRETRHIHTPSLVPRLFLVCSHKELEEFQHQKSEVRNKSWWNFWSQQQTSKEGEYLNYAKQWISHLAIIMAEAASKKTLPPYHSYWDTLKKSVDYYEIGNLSYLNKEFFTFRLNVSHFYCESLNLLGKFKSEHSNIKILVSGKHRGAGKTSLSFQHEIRSLTNHLDNSRRDSEGKMKIKINPGESSVEEIADFLSHLSIIYHKIGGDGIDFQISPSKKKDRPHSE